MEFIHELKNLGLTDKESAVYLALLELGSAPVQNIARKAKVVRATTYVVLEDLQKMGLVTHYKEGKKTLFSPEPPLQLMRLLDKQQEALKSKQDEFARALPELQMLMKTSGEKPSVRYFEGKEGLRAMRQEIIMYSKSGDLVYNFTPLDHLDAVFPFPNESDSHHRQRAAKGVLARTIFSTRSEKLKNALLQKQKEDKTERRYISPDLFSCTSGMTIYRDRIAIGSFTGKLMGVIIESEPMAETMRRLFDLAWIGTDHVDKHK